ncbi:hypothetical protein AK812_SmicGene13104 [Symbiodinium microadriaticum]|uniref:Uncharacterized protein n=1 Tax=Symbiodinium microadriaticum TaxID=2951 RepID=A0A1Q9E8Y1_SYMMI|nr:hypothetical protein AK812_SmicGene13104 [Symbiodinium microadriaticum]
MVSRLKSKALNWPYFAGEDEKAAADEQPSGVEDGAESLAKKRELAAGSYQSPPLALLLFLLLRLLQSELRPEMLKVANMFVGTPDTQARKEEKDKKDSGGPNSWKIAAKVWTGDIMREAVDLQVVSVMANYFGCESPQAVSSKHPEEWQALAKHVVLSLGSERVASREAAVQAAQTLFRGRLWSEVSFIFEDLWTIVVKLMDDMEQQIQAVVLSARF